MLIHVPDRALVAGDWHADQIWAPHVIARLPDLLPDESPRIVLHAGDFGIWGGQHGTAYLDRVDKSLTRYDAHIYVVEGNHEDFHLLHALAGSSDPRHAVQLRPTITWLPRGFRWTWHGRTWLALGGAVSVDRVARTPGVDWFPEEQITEAQTHRIMDDGPADVMLCHDAPAAVPLRLPPPPQWWDLRDLARSDRHRERLQAIVEVVQPTHLIHGHYHLEHDTVIQMPYGPLAVTGLDQNNARQGNYRVLDLRDMRYQTD